MIMRACVIMHNMIVEDEGVVDPKERFEYGGDNVQPDHGQPTRTLDEFIDAHKRIRDKETHAVERRPHRAPLEPLSRLVLAVYKILYMRLFGTFGTLYMRLMYPVIKHVSCHLVHCHFICLLWSPNQQQLAGGFQDHCS